MSRRRWFLVVLLLLSSWPAFAWKNGAMGLSPPGSPKFGTHDRIAHEALKMAEKDVDLAWLRKRALIYFLGTEAPDVGAPEELHVENGYHDTGACHCVLLRSRQNGERASGPASSGGI